MTAQTVFEKNNDPYEPRTGVDLYGEVAPRIVLPDNLPYLVYGIGIARSGTTVSLNVMTSSNVEDDQGKKYPIEASYQHFKAGYRQAMHGWPNDTDEKKWQFAIPDAETTPVFYMKDPLGPYTHTESTYNPLELLKMKDYPKDKLFLLFFLRDPKEILASWKRNWGVVRDEGILRDNLITSCHTLREIQGQAESEGYASGTYLYESLRDNSPEKVVGRMFDQVNEHMTPRTGLHLAMTDHSVGNWDLEDKKRIWHPDEPAIYTRPEIANLHQGAKTSPRLLYKKYTDETLGKLLTREDMTVLNKGGVYDDYEHFRARYMESTRLQVCSIEGAIGKESDGRMSSNTRK